MTNLASNNEKTIQRGDDVHHTIENLTGMVLSTNDGVATVMTSAGKKDWPFLELEKLDTQD